MNKLITQLFGFRSDKNYKGQFKTDVDETDSVQYNRMRGMFFKAN